MILSLNWKQSFFGQVRRLKIAFNFNLSKRPVLVIVGLAMTSTGQASWSSHFLYSIFKKQSSWIKIKNSLLIKICFQRSFSISQIWTQKFSCRILITCQKNKKAKNKQIICFFNLSYNKILCLTIRKFFYFLFCTFHFLKLDKNSSEWKKLGNAFKFYFGEKKQYRFLKN